MSETQTVPSARPGLVRAWFDTVLNPLIRALRSELEYLGQGNLTWRATTGSSAALLPVRRHIHSDADDNLEQFLMVNPEMSGLMDNHDAALSRLDAGVRVCHEILVKHIQASDLGQGPPDQSALDENDLPRYFAEYIVNGLRSLPAFYGTAKYWNQASPRYFALLSEPEIRLLWEEVESSKQEFGRAAATLLAALRETRSNLSFEFDVPIVEG